MQDLIPALYFPSSIVIIDDDKRFLLSLSQYLASVIPNKIDAFDSATQALSHIKKGKCVENYLPVYNLLSYKNPEAANATISNNKDKFISVVIADYTLSDRTGLEVLSQIEDEKIYKILLTATANEKIGIDAFNNGIIDYYIRKKEDDLASVVSAAVVRGEHSYFLKNSKNLLSSVLKTEPDSFLNNEEYKKFLKGYIQKYKVVQGYLIDRYGSYLLLDGNGNEFTFLVMPVTTVSSQIEILEESGLDNEANKV